MSIHFKHRHCLPSYYSLHIVGYFYLYLLIAIHSTLAQASTTQATIVINYHYRVLEEFPHATDFFTQGLEFHQGLLYEGSGQYGQSKIIARTINSTTVIKEQHNSPDIFGEGISLLNNKLYQLSWKAGLVFVYQQDNFTLLNEFKLEGEGWGLTNNGQQLIYSDGSDQLIFVDPKDFSVKRRLAVTLNSKPLSRLNELEWIKGLIYANIWQSNWIVMINPDNGHVVGRVRLDNLLPTRLRNKKNSVLNGIAYDHKQQRLLVTGKNWPRLYHIELINNNK